MPQMLYEFLMDGLPDPTTLLLRRGNKSPVGAFERLLYAVARQSGHLTTRWVLPDPAGGAGAAFNRDNEMVGLADLVLAFFDPEKPMTGGTGHVVETAIDRNVPVYSFTVGGTEWTGAKRLGDHDQRALWQEQIVSWFEE